MNSGMRWVALMSAACWVMACGDDDGGADAGTAGASEASGSGAAGSGSAGAPTAEAGSAGSAAGSSGSSGSAGGPAAEAGSAGSATSSGGHSGSAGGPTVEAGAAGAEATAGGSAGRGGSAGSAAGASGAPAEACAPGCEPDHACLRERCVSACGAGADELEALEAALAEGIEVVANLCDAPGATQSFSDAVSGDTWLYGISTQADASTGSTLLEVFRWQLPSGEADGVETTTVASYLAVSDGVVFASGFAALAAVDDGAFGYTTMAADSAGELLFFSEAGVTSLSAPANYDLVSVEPGTWLLNGHGAGSVVEGQGLYWIDSSEDPPAVVQVAAAVGEYSGSLVVLPEAGWVLAGAYDASFASQLYAIPWDGIEDLLAGRASAPLEADSDPRVTRWALPSSFELLGKSSLLVTSYTADFNPRVEAQEFVADGAGVTFGESRPVVAGAASVTGAIAAGDRILLSHSRGRLVVAAP